MSFPKHWTDLNKCWKLTFVEFWAQNCGESVPREIREWATTQMLSPQSAPTASSKQNKKVRAKQVLLT